MEYKQFEINRRIIELREKLELTQEEFAKAINLTRFSVSNYENNRREIPDRVVADICREFNVDFRWLTTGVGEIFSTSEQDYTALIDRVMAGENEFARNMFKTFAKFDEKEWALLEKMIDSYLDVDKK